MRVQQHRPPPAATAHRASTAASAARPATPRPVSVAPGKPANADRTADTMAVRSRFAR